MHPLVCVRMHSHYVRERCTAVCSIASEQGRHNSKQHVNMPPERAQEHKQRKAHTYQNTTHGAASCIIPGILPRYLVSIIHLLVIGGNEARPKYLQQSLCDASWSTGACILFVGRRSTTAETTAAAAHLEVTTHIFFSQSYLGRTRNFSEGSVQQHPSPCSFRKRVGRK